MTMIVMTENLATKIIYRYPSVGTMKFRKGSQKHGQRPHKNCEKVHF